MTLRERIADWISRGALTEAKGNAARQREMKLRCRKRYSRLVCKWKEADDCKNASQARLDCIARVARGEEE